MWENFTNRAKIILNYAREEAANLGHNAIGTEHILLGLLKLGEGVAYEVLKEMDVSEDDIKKELNKLIFPGTNKDKHLNPNQLVFTPRAKSVLQLAINAAKNLGHAYVGTEHILLGLLEEGEGIAARALLALDIKSDILMNNILKKLENMGVNEQQSNFAETLAQEGPNFFGVKDKKAKITERFSTNLTQLARENKLDPVIGRDKEISTIAQILLRRTKNNPILIGEAGVGKTAVIYGLAQKIAAGNIPDVLKKKEILLLDMAAIVAGTKYRGEFEQRIKFIIDEVKKSKNLILFIDEIHTVIGAGSAEGTLDAAHMLKQPLSQGELQIIGATTIDEHRKFIEKDKALMRRFQTVTIDEPSIDDTIEILKGLRDTFEVHHKIMISDEAIIAAVKLSDRYITDRKLPDKSIDIIDESGARKKINMPDLPDDISALEEELKKIENFKNISVKKQEFEQAAKYRDEYQTLSKKIEKLKSKVELEKNHSIKITEIDIAEVISSWTGIPLNKLTENESAKLLNFEAEIHRRLVSQDEAVISVANAIRRSRLGLKNKKRPVGSFLFLGPTGVGKTELARALAEILFGSEDALIRLDMSEFMERFTVSRLIGAPPGYVGYQEGGELTEKVRRKPYSVILFDEIEKAHPDVFNILLQVLDDGQLTDNLGHKVNFKNCIIIMTSNIGAKEIVKGKNFGFAVLDKANSYEDMKKKVLSEVKKIFKPEFLNRLDEIIVFKPLTKENISSIIDIMLKDVYASIEEKEMFLIVSDDVKNFLIEKGYDETYGARPLRRAIQKYIEDALSVELLENTFKPGDKIKATLEKEKIIFQKV